MIILQNFPDWRFFFPYFAINIFPQHLQQQHVYTTTNGAKRVVEEENVEQRCSSTPCRNGCRSTHSKARHDGWSSDDDDEEEEGSFRGPGMMRSSSSRLRRWWWKRRRRWRWKRVGQLTNDAMRRWLCWIWVKFAVFYLGKHLAGEIYKNVRQCLRSKCASFTGIDKPSIWEESRPAGAYFGSYKPYPYDKRPWSYFAPKLSQHTTTPTYQLAQMQRNILHDCSPYNSAFHCIMAG